MPNTEDYKAQGFIERRELIDLVAEDTSYNRTTVNKWLTGPMNKIRGVLVIKGLIVEPDDSSWKCLYHPDLEYFFVAYLNWHRFGERRSVVQVVRFFGDFERRDSKVLRHMPERVKRRLQRHDRKAKQGKPDNVVHLHNAG